jgi:hypothetical protein
MRTLGLLRERWIAFWRAANDLALVMDADPFEDIYGRVARLEAAVHGRAAAHPVPGSPAPSQDSSPAESRMATKQRKRGAIAGTQGLENSQQSESSIPANICEDRLVGTREQQDLSF